MSKELGLAGWISVSISFGGTPTPSILRKVFGRLGLGLDFVSDFVKLIYFAGNLAVRFVKWWF